MTDRITRAVETATAWDRGNIEGLDDAMTRRLVASTVMTESDGGDLRITNAQGYAGRYQAGASWLVEAGLVNRERREEAFRASGYDSEWAWAEAGGMTRFLQDPANWNDGLSLERYLGSAELQDGAFQTVSNQTYARAIREGVLHPDDTPEHIAGFLKAAHLSGFGGASKVISGASVEDANGTSNVGYYNDIAINQDRIDARMGLDAQRDRSVLVRGALEDGTLVSGERGEGVRQLQEALAERGFPSGRPDGQFGNNTLEALRAYQVAQNLPRTGEADAALLANLRIGSRIHPMPDRALADGVLQNGERGDAVRDLQEALRAQGQPQTGVDGSFGPGTERAVRGFQESAGLPGTGRADRATLEALGLGNLLDEYPARLDQHQRIREGQAIAPAEVAPRAVVPGATEAERATPPVASGDAERAASTGNGTVWPVPGVYEIKPVARPGDGHSHFGAPRGNRTHGGIDIGSREGDTVVAFAAGEVTVIPNNKKAGNTVVIDHDDGTRTRYFHLQDGSLPEPGRVEAGDPIGRVGSTGNARGLTPHLHFEFYNAAGERVDPAPYLRATGPEAERALGDFGRGGIPTPVLREDSRGPQVEELQRFLNQAQQRTGDDRLDDDGRFGPRTREAVETFQRAHGLEPDGIVGRDTRAKIDELRSQPMFDGELRLRESGDEVRAMQVSLNQIYRDSDGWTPLEEDGKFGGLTQGAVERFQRDQGLEATGVANADTLARIQSVAADGTAVPARAAERTGDQDAAVVAPDALSATERLAAAMRSNNAEDMARVIEEIARETAWEERRNAACETIAPRTPSTETETPERRNDGQLPGVISI